MKQLALIILFLISHSLSAQTVNFKKDILPLINSSDYSQSAKSITLQYNQQNTNEDGTLTSKAILVAYDNVLQARQHIGLCYYNQAVEELNLAYTDSALFYFNLVKEMDGGDNVTILINGVKDAQRKIQNKLNAQRAMREEEERIAKYALKTDTVTFVFAEFTGNCKTVFEDQQGNILEFYNPELGKYRDESEMICQVRQELFEEPFLVTHQLKFIRVYFEDVGETEFESPVLKSIALLNRDKEAQLNEQIISSMKSQASDLIAALEKTGQVSAEKLSEYAQWRDTMSIPSIQNEQRLLSIQSELKKAEASADGQALLESQAKEFGGKQKQLKSSISCPTCPKTTLKQFLLALKDSNMPKAKSSLSQCCMVSTDAEAQALGCGNSNENLKGVRALSYKKLVEAPSQGVTTANTWLNKEARWFVFFESKTVAKIIITPEGEMGAGVRYFCLVLEGGSWKVYGSDDNERRRYVVEYAKENL